MEEGKKYCAKLKKMEKELAEARLETNKLEHSQIKARDIADDVLSDWDKLIGQTVEGTELGEPRTQLEEDRTGKRARQNSRGYMD